LKPLIDFNDANRMFNILFCCKGIELVIFFSEHDFRQLAFDILDNIYGVQQDEL